MLTRRKFLGTTAASAGAIVLLPYAARAAGHGSDSFETANGMITVYPVDHASFVMETPSLTIYNDPIGDPANYEGKPRADLILITHQHGDHYNPETIAALSGEATLLIVNPAVFALLPEALKTNANVLANGESMDVWDITVSAVPAYNMTEDRLQYHPQGRDNGYVLMIDGFKVYIAGDTEDVPEMRAMTDVDLAFVPMILPYTMDEAAAASAVSEFAPRYVYPYHYRGSDIAAFSAAVTSETEVKEGPWYG